MANILKNVTIPNDTNSPNQLQFAVVLAQLNAGTVSFSLPGFPENTPVIPVVIAPAAAINLGFLNAQYDTATDTVTVNSSNGADDSLLVCVILGG